MTTNNTITSNFWSQLQIIMTIVAASVIGFKYAVTEMKSVVIEQVAPIVQRLERVEKGVIEHERLFTMVIDHINSNIRTVEEFIFYYNQTYHKEFLVPSQITINDLKDIKEE